MKPKPSPSIPKQRAKRPTGIRVINAVPFSGGWSGRVAPTRIFGFYVLGSFKIKS